MSGPPGAGKTMLARRLPGILPGLDDEDAVQAASLRSLAGEPVDTLCRTPPFEAPHHSASATALIGGGSRAVRPGAIARASGESSFDEAGEFARTRWTRCASHWSPA
jgi:magnesium chelatase family protein